MELSNEFTVDVPIKEAWVLLTDVERIAPCMPGAQLTEVEGDEYRGVVKVKVGPITSQYKGKATFVERDEEAFRAVLKAEGRETKGQGNASATITAALVAEGDRTTVSVVTDLTITGRAAQFGRGVLADVSSKLLGQFVACLEKNVLSGGDAGPPEAEVEASAETAAEAPAGASDAAGAATAAPADVPAREVAEGPVGNGSSAATAASQAASAPQRVESYTAEPVDLLDAAGMSVAKRLAPVVGVAVAFLVWVGLRRRRAGS
ncbi:MAG: SRPBCC family protein [Acidimicrobiia bacterium]